MFDVINDVSQFWGKRLRQYFCDDVIQHLTFDRMKGNDLVNFSGEAVLNRVSSKRDIKDNRKKLKFRFLIRI